MNLIAVYWHAVDKLNTARYQQLQDKFHQRESTELQGRSVDA